MPLGPGSRSVDRTRRDPIPSRTVRTADDEVAPHDFAGLEKEYARGIEESVVCEHESAGTFTGFLCASEYCGWRLGVPSAYAPFAIAKSPRNVDEKVSRAKRFPCRAFMAQFPGERLRSQPSKTATRGARRQNPKSVLCGSHEVVYCRQTVLSNSPTGYARR